MQIIKKTYFVFSLIFFSAYICNKLLIFGRCIRSVIRLDTLAFEFKKRTYLGLRDFAL